MTDMTTEQGAWPRLTKMIHEYIDDYHLEGDEGSYTPTRRERLIAEDIIISMLVDDEMASAIRAALEAAREDGWQPIETAPDEAWFLVHSDRGWIGLARRSDPDYAPDEGWFEDEHTEFLDPAWLTHWRPLPAPPAIDRARGKGGKEAGND